MRTKQRITINMLVVAALTLSTFAPASALARPTPHPDPGLLSKLHSGVSAQVEGGATGDGPATDSQCEHDADLINQTRDDAADAAAGNDGMAALDLLALAEGVMEESMSDGCFFVE